MNIEFLANLLGDGPLHTAVIVFSLAAMVLAAAIWIMEFSGWTISRKGLVRNNVQWNATSIALVAVCAAIYIAVRPITITLIPGFAGVGINMILAPIFSILFGLPGAIGVTFSMPIGDAISGALTLGSVAGFLSHTFVTWLPYKMVQDFKLKSLTSMASFYLWGVLIGPIIHSIVIPGWLDFTHILPPAVAWGGVAPIIFVNHGIVAAILAPVVLAVLYPLVKARGLYWRDRYRWGDETPMEKPLA